MLYYQSCEYVMHQSYVYNLVTFQKREVTKKKLPKMESCGSSQSSTTFESSVQPLDWNWDTHV